MSTDSRREIESRPQAVRRRMALRLAAPRSSRLPPTMRHRDRLRRPLQCRQVEPDQRAHRPEGAGPHLAHAGPHPGAHLLRRSPRPLRWSTCRATAMPRRRRTRSKAWTELIHAYLRGRANLARVYVLVDARHGLKDADERRARRARRGRRLLPDRAHQGRPVKPAELGTASAETHAAHRQARRPPFPTCLPTSAARRPGIPELRAAIARLLLNA